MSAFFNPISLVHLNYLPFFLSETVEEPEKSVNRHFFPAKTHYFATCTSLLYKFRRENQEPGLSSPILFLKKKRPPS
jgi:hypothetical protein